MSDDLAQRAHAATLAFTGERYTPETDGNIYLEHMHRYVMVRDLIAGRDVLDIASGEGFGSADMAQRARSVIGVDIDAASVAHAQQRYRAPNLEFRTGSCTAIPLEDDSVDVVVSFETIEHHDEHERMMRDVRRVLRPGGVIIISSPEKHAYTDVPGTRNPFHVKELYRDEFAALMTAHFRHVAMYGQRVVFGSAMFLEARESRMQTIDARTLEHADGLMRPLYLVAVASDDDLPALPASSFFEEEVLKSEIVTVQLNNREIERDLARRAADEHLAAARQLERNLEAMASLANQQARHIKAVHRSLSWQLTAPLRWLGLGLLGLVASEKRKDLKRKLARPPSFPQQAEPPSPETLPKQATASEAPGPEESAANIDLLFPIGHFYSPIADPADIAARKDRIFARRDGSPGIDYREKAQLELLADIAPHIRAIDYPVDDPGDGQTYFYNNDQFPALDAEFLHAALCHFRPARMIEVGSGFSSLVTASVNRTVLGGALEFACIDPYPRQFLIDGVDGITDLVVSRVEDVDPTYFDRLGDGDILFIDPSHVSKVGSDVNHLFFEVLPRLKPGVVVHVHDIFLPDAYPQDWVLAQNRNWNAQYLLQAFLQFNDRWQILWASHLMGTRHAHAVEAVFARVPRLGRGGSFWIRRTG